MKWIHFLFNPSKRIKRLLTKPKDDDPSYILKKRLAKLNLPVTSDLNTISYFSVFSKLFLLLGLTLIVGFGTYFTTKNIELKRIAKFICDLKIPILSYEFDIKNLNKEKVDNNVIIFLFLGSLYLLIFGVICFLIGYYSRFSSFLPLATFILAITIGIFFGIEFFLYNFLSDNNKFVCILHLLFWIPFVTTIFVLSSVSFLYYFKKICLSEKKVNLVTTMFFSLHLISIAFTFYKYWVSLDEWVVMIIFMVLAILDIVLSTLMWVVTLQQLDQFIEQKRPYKCQWFLISILFITAIEIFASTLYIVLVIIKMMKITKND